MSAAERSSLARRGFVGLAALVGMTTWALLHFLRVTLLLVLGVREPIVRMVLSLLPIAGMLTAALYYFAGSPGLKVSYGISIAFSVGCALALALYERLLGMLRR